MAQRSSSQRLSTTRQPGPAKPELVNYYKPLVTSLRYLYILKILEPESCTIRIVYQQ